tara:strand:+ start:1124 stop:1603 length:480 start_codon:yes stop_codon:yes gene_type:complete
MARRIREAKVDMASGVLFLPTAEEIPLLQSVMDLSPAGITPDEYDGGVAIWWEAVRTALQDAFDNTAIKALTERVTEVEVISETQSVVISESSLWDGGQSSTASWETSADGGWAGPRIFSMDGGTPSTNHSHVVRPEASKVDEATTTDLITGSYSGGTA